MDRTNLDYEKAIDNIIFVLIEAKKIRQLTETERIILHIAKE